MVAAPGNRVSEAPARADAANGGGAQKQMGPTLLSTPLSPMRGHFRRNKLGIRCFSILLRQAAEIRVCHRRSHRHPDPPSGRFSESRSGRSHRVAIRSPNHQRLVPRSDDHAGPSSGCPSSGPKTIRSAPIGRRPDNPAREKTTSHFHHRRPCVRPKPLAGVPPDVRDRFRHVIPVENFPKYFPTVRSSNPGRVPPRSDELKLRPMRRFDKLASRRFSTFPRFHCGREWITHHFVANMRCVIICRAWPAGAAAAR